jgi:hypothetical protein
MYGAPHAAGVRGRVQQGSARLSPPPPGTSSGAHNPGPPPTCRRSLINDNPYVAQVYDGSGLAASALAQPGAKARTVELFSFAKSYQARGRGAAPGVGVGQGGGRVRLTAAALTRGSAAHARALSSPPLLAAALRCPRRRPPEPPSTPRPIATLHAPSPQLGGLRLGFALGNADAIAALEDLKAPIDFNQ